MNGVDVYPGIRYTARVAGDALGELTIDDCTFWYSNEYYTLELMIAFSRAAKAVHTRVSNFVTDAFMIIPGARPASPYEHARP